MKLITVKVPQNEKAFVGIILKALEGTIIVWSGFTDNSTTWSLVIETVKGKREVEEYITEETRLPSFTVKEHKEELYAEPCPVC